MSEATLEPTTETPTGPTRDHASYIGGSDIAALVGISPYKTPLAVWAEKTRRYAFTGNEFTELGDHLERPVVELYAKRRKVGLLLFTGTLSHPDIPHIAATPDAIADMVRGVQVKIVGNHQAYRWGEPLRGAETVPPEVVLQIQYEAALARLRLQVNADLGDAVALIGTELRVYEITIDRELGDNLIVIADDWWRTYVANDVMPLVTEDDVDTLRAIYPRPSGPIRLATEEVKALAREYDACRAAEKIAKEAKERVGAQLCALIGATGGYASITQGIKATWDEKAGATSWKEVAKAFRLQALKAGISGAQLDEIERAHKSEPSRTLNVRVKEQ